MTGAPTPLTTRRRWLIALLIALPAVMLRVHLFYTGRLPFDSDQAIPGIGALRLLAGGDHLVYLPGQSFGGEVHTYWFLPWHLLMGPSPALMRLGMLPWTLLLWFAMWRAAKALFRNDVGAFAVLLVAAFPSAMVLDWTMHAASTHIVVPIALSLCCRPLIDMVDRQWLFGWRSRDVRRLLVTGLLLGVAFWSDFSTLAVMVSILAALLLCPRALAIFLGIDDVWVNRGEIVTWPLMLALAVGQIVLLLAASHAMLIEGTMRTGLLLALGAGVFTFLSAEMRARAGGLTRLPPWGLAFLFGGLWIGAFPVLLFNATPGNETFFAESQMVGSLGVFAERFVSVFTRGLPVLMGMRDDHGAVPAGVPWILRVLPLLIALVAFAVVIKRLAKSRRRLDGDRFGPALIVTTVLATAICFAASDRVSVIDSPRGILPLWWAMAMAIGFTVNWLWRRRRAAVLIALAVLLVNGMAISLARPPREVVNLLGLEQSDVALFRLLDREGITRVSCRFAGPHSYWLAWRLSYISGGDILFGHQDSPGHAEIRQPEWQREVDTARAPAYLVNHVDEGQLFGPCLDALGVEYEWAAIHPMRLFWNLEPDLVRRRNMADFQAFIDERTRP